MGQKCRKSEFAFQKISNPKIISKLNLKRVATGQNVNGQNTDGQNTDGKYAFLKA